MEIKKLTLLLALGLGLLPLHAQENNYFLPSTTILVQVESRQESFFAGPYAAFAKQMLNIDVNDADEVTNTLTRVELVPVLEADLSTIYSCDAESAGFLSLSAQGLVAFSDKAEAERYQWRFLPLVKADFSRSGLTDPEKEEKRIIYRNEITEEGEEIRIPVEHKVLVEKTLEDKALDAADMVLAVRKARLDIATGNTDANYSGEAMNAALRELDRIEQEYITLFTGYSVVRTQTATFEVRPSALNRNHHYLAFRLTEDGPVADGNLGTPYYLELEPEAIPELSEEAADKRRKGPALHYRIPAICTVRLSADGKPLLSTRIPIYQLGKENSLVTNK